MEYRAREHKQEFSHYVFIAGESARRPSAARALGDELMVPKDTGPAETLAGRAPAVNPFGFRAFISYSHRDTKIAEWLHRSIETYRVPKPLIGRVTSTGEIGPRPGKIFRDRDELEVAADLSGKINEALQQSQFLIVLCSPASARSKWVNQEVINFKRLKGAERIIAVIADGEPGASAIPGREAEECFVPALRFKVTPNGKLSDEPAEPIAADLREGKDTKSRVRLKVVAGVLGVGLDELIRRDSQRRTRMMFYASVAMGCITVALAGLTIEAVQSRNLAVAAQANADRKRVEAEEMIEFLLGDLRTKLEPVGRLDVLDAVGEKVLDHFSSLRPEEQDDQALARRARALLLLGTIAMNKGNLGVAEQRFLESRDTTALLMKRDPTNPQRKYEFGEAVTQLGLLLYKQGHYEDAGARYRETLNIALDLNRGESPTLIWRAQLARSWRNLGIVSSNLMAAERAIQELETAAGIFLSISDTDPKNPIWRKEIGTALEWIASTLYTAGSYRESMDTRQRQVGVYTSALLQDPENKSLKVDLIVALRSLGNINLNFGDTELARTKLAEAFALVTSLTDLDPGNADWRSGQGRILLDLVDSDLEAGDLANAEKRLQRAELIAVELTAKDPNILGWQIDLVHRAASFRARYEIARGRASAAIQSLTDHDSQLRELRAKFPKELALRDRALLAEKYRGIARSQMGDKIGAAAAFSNILASSAYRPEHFEIQAAVTHVIALVNLGRFLEAYPIMQRIEKTGYRRKEFVAAMKETKRNLGVN